MPVRPGLCSLAAALLLGLLLPGCLRATTRGTGAPGRGRPRELHAGASRPGAGGRSSAGAARPRPGGLSFQSPGQRGGTRCPGMRDTRACKGGRGSLGAATEDPRNRQGPGSGRRASPGSGLAPMTALCRGAPPGSGAEKAGVCPRLREDLNCTQKECQTDGDCADNLKCCRAGCGTVCSMPNEKKGTCPSVDFPQLGLCQDQCEEDSQCEGLMKCCRNGCGKVTCVTPNF
ncbi:WAP four-disulfide core domain protein 2 [Ctenodactylus gundi]